MHRSMQIEIELLGRSTRKVRQHSLCTLPELGMAAPLVPQHMWGMSKHMQRGSPASAQSGLYYPVTFVWERRKKIETCTEMR
jgi:hypothetical protein